MPGTDRLVSLNVSIPFGRWLGHNMAEHEQLNSMYATAQMSRDQDGVTQMQTGVSGTLLKGNNMNYSVMQGRSSRSGGSGSLNASWQGEAGRASGGYSYSRNEHAWNWDLSGGAVAHADGVTFSQSLGDTNVLIKAPGARGVHVENETGVSTDWRGYAVMPYATMYRRNRVALDVKSLDMHTDLDDTVAAPCRRAPASFPATGNSSSRTMLLQPRPVRDNGAAPGSARWVSLCHRQLQFRLPVQVSTPSAATTRQQHRKAEPEYMHDVPAVPVLYRSLTASGSGGCPRVKQVPVISPSIRMPWSSPQQPEKKRSQAVITEQHSIQQGYEYCIFPEHTVPNHAGGQTAPPDSERVLRPRFRQ